MNDKEYKDKIKRYKNDLIFILIVLLFLLSIGLLRHFEIIKI